MLLLNVGRSAASDDAVHVSNITPVNNNPMLREKFENLKFIFDSSLDADNGSTLKSTTG